MKYRAVFRDGKGSATYSAPVEIRDGKWQMKTSEGFRPITFHFDDDEAGRLTFSHYREEPEPEDLGLHLPERIGTENSFQQLQRAYVEQEVVAQRKHREAARAQAQQSSVTPAKIEAARELNTQFANARKPRGRGVGVIPE